MSFWENKKVLVTGGAGFIGSHLVELLVAEGARVRVVDSLEKGTLDNLRRCWPEMEFMQGELRDSSVCERACDGMDIVMHLAAKVGGVGYNVAHPGEMFTTNVLMNTNIMEAARKADVKRYLCVSSACVYRRYCSIPTPESEGFVDDPEPTNLGYGWSKRIAEVQARCFSHEYGMKIAIVRPYNAYGPRDDFELDTAHVISALIRKVVDGQNPVNVWGNGEQTRAFVYVTDIARGMMMATEHYAAADPLNIGTEHEIKIKELVHLIVNLSGKIPAVFFDTSKPSGQPRRNAETTKAKKIISYEPQVSLENGLKKTIEWYKASRAQRGVQ